MLVIDRNFLAYFYAVVEDEADAAEVVEEIEAERTQYLSVTKLEVVERKFFGKPVKSVKVYCTDPNCISKYSKIFRNFEGIKGCLEDDVRYSMRYLIDNNVVPCEWHEIEVPEEVNTLGVQADKVYTTKSLPKFIEKTEVPQLKILGFSTICYSKEGSPKPDRNPVIIISVATNKGEEKQFSAKNQNDKPVLEAPVNYVQNFDPDLIVGYGVNRKEPSGFYREVLGYLINVRNEIRSKMKAVPRETTEYRVLDARQKAVKVITNASYGYAGWIGARWYIKPVAEAATAWGRHAILTVIKIAEKAGLKVVYSDTDSLFIKHDAEKIEKLSSEIREKLGLEIKPDKIYVRIFFTEAKKRYAGLLPDGRLDIVGLEVVRGDWAAIAKKVQEKILEIILKEQYPKKAAKFVQQFVYDLWQRRVPYRDLIIWKTLTKPVDEYAIRASHVEAAKMLKEKGWRLTVK